MEKIDKELFYRELCARMPYKPVICTNNGSIELLDHIKGKIINGCSIDQIKIFLRPIDSMTDKEKKKLSSMFTWGSTLADAAKAHAYLYSIHVDYSGLIEKGVALAAPKDMY